MPGLREIQFARWAVPGRVRAGVVVAEIAKDDNLRLLGKPQAANDERSQSDKIAESILHICSNRAATSNLSFGCRDHSFSL